MPSTIGGPTSTISDSRVTVGQRKSSPSTVRTLLDSGAWDNRSHVIVFWLSLYVEPLAVLTNNTKGNSHQPSKPLALEQDIMRLQLVMLAVALYLLRIILRFVHISAESHGVPSRIRVHAHAATPIHRMLHLQTCLSGMPEASVALPST
jgi:hypothetical protein